MLLSSGARCEESVYCGFFFRGLGVVEVVVDEAVDDREAKILSSGVEVAFRSREVDGDVKDGIVRSCNALSDSIFPEDKSLGASLLSGSSARTTLKTSAVFGEKVAVVRFVARVVLGGWRLARNGCTTRGTTKAPREKLKWSA